jgi:F-type H+-transporting ATPase subunit delta
VAEQIDAGARVYASALYRAAVDAGRVAEFDRDLAAFVTSLAEQREVLQALLNPQLPGEAKRRIVSQVLKDADPLVRNAVMVLVDNGRVSFIADLQVAYSELAAVEEQILDVEVTSAVPLAPAQVEDIERRISEATGLTARLDATVDPSIIGGLVLRARGVLLDASVRRELHDLRRTLTTTPLPLGSEA